MVSIRLSSLVVALLVIAPAGMTFPSAVQGRAVLLDFTASWCGPCRTMDPVVARLKSDGYPVQKIDVDQQPELAATYGVTKIPCFVVLRDGKEAARQEGVTQYERLVEMIQSAAVAAAEPATAVATAVSEPPRPMPPSPATPPLEPSDGAAEAAHITAGPSGPALGGPAAGGLIAGSAPDAAGAKIDVPIDVPLPSPDATIPARLVSHEELIQSTVRLRVEDRSGHSYGTGTIIHVQDGEAVLLTCGHIFREAKMDGRITVDLLTEGGPLTVSGCLLNYDLERDLGLVKIRANVPVRAARVAPRDAEIAPGQRVLSCGCNHGQQPTVQSSHVTAIGRYAGPPNVEVAGAPVEGRSGGGLFDEQGRLIGVCFAADPADNEGLFAGIESIHSALDCIGLRTAPQPHDLVAEVIPAGSGAAVRAVGGQSPAMSDSEQAILAELAGRPRDTEVILIIRSPDSHTKSEILVLQNVSEAFRDLLARGGRTGPERQLTTREVVETAMPSGGSSGTRPPRAFAEPAVQPPRTDGVTTPSR